MVFGVNEDVCSFVYKDFEQFKDIEVIELVVCDLFVL